MLTSAGFKSSVFSIEFKKDPRDGKLKLIENNVRLVRINWLATSCGVKFPWVMYLDLVENRQIDIGGYKKDVYWIELYSDIFNSIFRHGRENISFRDYLRPYLARNKTFAVFSLFDPLPFIKHSLNLPRFFFRQRGRFPKAIPGRERRAKKKSAIGRASL